jgi:methanogenic corrinoid protein MtbC1
MRQEPELAAIKVVVGGRAFSDNRDLWQRIGADACASDLAEARQLLRSFRKAS